MYVPAESSPVVARTWTALSAASHSLPDVSCCGIDNGRLGGKKEIGDGDGDDDDLKQ